MSSTPGTRPWLVVLFFGLAIALGLAVGVAVVGLPVTILTGYGGIGPITYSSDRGCYLSSISAKLVTDPTYGTAVIEHDPTGLDRHLPVMWLPGDTARRSGSEVEILDRTGSVIARTGQAWQIEGGYYGVGDVRIWVACGYVLPFSAAQ